MLIFFLFIKNIMWVFKKGKESHIDHCIPTLCRLWIYCIILPYFTIQPVLLRYICVSTLLISLCTTGGFCDVPIEIDTLEYQQTEKIETELKDVDRIRANRCMQLCPGSPSGAFHSHNTIYYSFPADSPPSRKEGPRWRVLYRITGSSFTVPDAGVLVRKLKQLAELSRLTPSVSYCSVESAVS